MPAFSKPITAISRCMFLASGIWIVQTHAGAATTVSIPVGANTETTTTVPIASGEGFEISIDGAGGGNLADAQRTSDIQADLQGIQIRFNGLGASPELNVLTTEQRTAYQAGETVTFRTYSNYPAYFRSAEIRIVERRGPRRGTVTRIPAPANGLATWTVPADGSGRYEYTLRVIDADGRYDETIPLPIYRLADSQGFGQAPNIVLTSGIGEDRTAKRRIRVVGGQVTVSGKRLGPYRDIQVMGESVPLDPNGSFVVTRILPAGTHIVDVRTGAGRPIQRQIEIPRSEWFRVGLAEITIGRRLRDDLISADPDYEPNYTNGRFALFADGITRNGVRITAAADTGDGPLEDAFRRFDQKDPMSVIDRLDVAGPKGSYGDNSSLFDLAPSQGRVFLRAEKNGAYAQWGDFETQVASPVLLEGTRSLYGAEAYLPAMGVTGNGDPRLSVRVHAAQPDTLPQNDILRGTGGSVYFTSHRDISPDSEQIFVRSVDPDTGRVTSSRELEMGVDYTVDYFHGVLHLANPLTATISSPTGPQDQELVVMYEYSPPIGTLDGASTGGRVEFRPTDNIRLGVTAMSETTGVSDQNIAGADAQIGFGTGGFIEIETARTDGPGFGSSIATDGGLGFVDAPSSGGTGTAERIAVHVPLADIGLNKKGHFGFFGERKSAGFSTLSSEITEDQEITGFDGAIEVSDRVSLSASSETFETAAGERRSETAVGAAVGLSDYLTATLTLENLDMNTPAVPEETGDRLDGRLTLDWVQNENRRVFAFGQATFDVSGGLDRTDRVGVGIEQRLTEKLTFTGEVSNGVAGSGAQGLLSYTTNRGEVYAGYTLDPTREGFGYDLIGEDRGTWVVGTRGRLGNGVSGYAETRRDMYGERQSSTNAYGVTYTPNAEWTLSGSAEVGQINDPTNGDFDRTSLSFGFAKSGNEQSLSGRFEYRIEDGEDPEQDRTTWGVSGGWSMQPNEDWRLITSVDTLFSQSAETDLLDGEYVEAQVAYVYRPAVAGRLQAIARYRFLLDQPGDDQVNYSGDVDGPKQRSNMFEIDGTYRVTEKLSIGGKYGIRQSEVAPRGTDDYDESTAQLVVGRVDWHAVQEWDVGAEGRALFDTAAETTETGGALGIYRHFGPHAKVGVGYEFGKVSDDLANIDYISQGIFLNLLAKY